ncbi:MAG TPA: CehA/McbA family metallohydrolase [Vicinamibacteria bacterium]|nr:CehA/McbA family metallohydrolase [Vicinamibacteria bacterium]
MRIRRVVVGAILLVLVGGAVWVVLWRPLEVSGPAPDDGYTRVRGVVHVHTTLSDGGGTPAEVAAAAKRAGLGFVAITDHNNLDAKPFEGYHDGVLVLVGSEISTASSGHVLGLGLREDPPFRFSGDPLDALDDVRLLGGHAFAAHPSSPRADFRWTAWDLPGPWGLELMNGDSQWRAAGWGRLLRTAALYGLHPGYALLGSLTPPDDTLAQWDRLLAARPVAGIAGADAHSRVVVRKERGVRFPSYESLFGLAVNHVLLDRPLSGEAAADGHAIVDALARGQGYMGLDALAPAEGFFFTAESATARTTMGGTIAPLPAPRLRAGGRLPAGARRRLVRDGQAATEAETALDLPAPGPGVYRVEVRVPGWDVPWVLSNPIGVFAPAEAAARAARAAFPDPADPPAATTILDAFDGPTSFAAEFDASSAMETPVVVPGAGADGSGAARLSFRLGPPGPGRPYTWCALVSRQPRDLTGASGLVFSLRADRTYRIWVQVRDENPASADEGTEWWFASVRPGPEWRRVAVPFARLRSINPNSDGRLDLDRVRQLVFVLDPAAVEPGTQGAIWLDNLGLY